MGKNSSNPLKSFKNAFNKASETVSTTYTNVSKDVANTATKIIPPNLINNESDAKSKELTKNKELTNILPKNVIQEEINPELNSFEKKIQSLYIGCFSDDPSNPSMEKDFGTVSNSLECIELGKKNNYKFVGIQQGNRCFASNKIPTTTEVNKNEYCNVGCDDINTGNCGGFFYNQVYKTDFSSSSIDTLKKIINDEHDKNKKHAESTLENFINMETDIEKINYGLSHVNYNCHTPLNPHYIIAWFIVLILLIYLLVEYLYKKSQK